MRNFKPWCHAAFFLILLLACSNRDDRNGIRGNYGEPDAIQTQGKDIFWRELWFYDAAGAGFEFRRTTGCGSNQEVYLYSTFAFIPDTSGVTATPILLPGQRSPGGDTLIAPSKLLMAP